MLNTIRPNTENADNNSPVYVLGFMNHFLRDFLMFTYLFVYYTILNVIKLGFHDYRFFVSNYGDYAWGREGLDTIVTQLLNQMDSSGPPPLAKDKIKELPFVIITEKHVCKTFVLHFS